MDPIEDRSRSLGAEIGRIASEAGAEGYAAAFYDYETDEAWAHDPDRWFHAASTIKVAILVGVFAAIDEARFEPHSRVHVRNRFYSAADALPFRVDPATDSTAAVHHAIGKTMRVDDLARHMIVTSSNLATNLLLDVVGTGYMRGVLDRIGIRGIDLRRGVDDSAAFDAGINNRVTAGGLVALFRAIEERRAVSPAACDRMLDILHKQEFTSGIPAGLPDDVRGNAKVANKTGEISTVAHDAGLVFLPGRQPYALAILTQWAAGTSGRNAVVARISRAIYTHLMQVAT
jgi:beta-lactamase class A